MQEFILFKCSSVNPRDFVRVKLFAYKILKVRHITILNKHALYILSL